MISEKRPVEVLRYNTEQRLKEHDYHGAFLGWGMDWEEQLSTGIAHTTVAIVEKDNGTVALVHPSLVRFTHKEPSG